MDSRYMKIALLTFPLPCIQKFSAVYNGYWMRLFSQTVHDKRNRYAKRRLSPAECLKVLCRFCFLCCLFASLFFVWSYFGGLLVFKFPPPLFLSGWNKARVTFFVPHSLLAGSLGHLWPLPGLPFPGFHSDIAWVEMWPINERVTESHCTSDSCFR